MYADIIVDISHEKLDRVFQYKVPRDMEGELSEGMEVVIPFGKGNREIRGYIVGFSEDADYDKDKIKKILRISENAVRIESKLIALAAWMKSYYGGTLIQSLKTTLPIKKKEKVQESKTIKLLLPKEEGEAKLALYLHKNQKARARLLAALLEQPEQDYGLLKRTLHITKPVVDAMAEQKVISITSQLAFRNPIHYEIKERQKLTFSEDQKQVIDSFWADYEKGIRKTYLLHGVTGSGKTEVYMEMIARVLKEGRQAIFLIPEISLTYQTVLRFYGRFGSRVSVLNSKMSAGERSDQMERVKRGEVDVMIGPRSALFTPFSRLGLIVMDEEHENSYKSEQTPRYHAREVAIKRGELEDASVVLGSATPSLESYHACKIGQFKLLELKDRIGERGLPQVYIQDMREELSRGNRSILSDKLRELMKDRLQKGQQTILFINRRGYAGFLSCRACGYVVKCPHCDVSLALHRGGKMVCHYCGYTRSQINACPSCGSSYIGEFKAGTQQIEDMVKRTFPTARVLRMDLDTTRKKDGYEKILEKFGSGEADILLGTQMIVKGHDFPNVTLVGVLAADMSLHTNDYRAGERTFQLLTQAAGRAGRGQASGEVVIQTYSPDHYSIALAAEQDYRGFYEKEMKYRELCGYPPANELLAILMTGPDEKQLELAAGYIKAFALKYNKDKNITIIGPASPYVGKVNDVYRRVIYIKSQDYKLLVGTKDLLEKYIEINSGFKTMGIQFDFNPMNVF